MDAPTITPTPQTTAAPTPKPPSSFPKPATAALTLAAASALAACGGGSSADESAEFTLPEGLATRPTSTQDAARFLTQATPGFTREELDALMRSGSYAEWLDAQFAAPRSASHTDWMLSKGHGAEGNRYSDKGLDASIWRKFISSPDGLRQRVVLALSELCVVSQEGLDISWSQFAAAHYLDILENHAFGNYRQLLSEISLSPAMGCYLTYRGNAKADPKKGSEPDENYARELMQLFTIGLVMLNPDGSTQTAGGKPVETYSQADVSGLARVFTGWGINGKHPYSPDLMRQPMTQTASRHESGSKSFLGTTIPAGTSASASLERALDVLFNHPNLPIFVGKQMIQRLVTSNPGPGYVRRVAAAFSNNGAGVRGDMKALVTAILLDPEAREPSAAARADFGKLREPVLRFLGWARSYGARSSDGTWSSIGDLSNPSSRLGQSPMHSPSVFNFFRPGYVPPNSSFSDQGLVAPELQITNEVTVASYVNYMQSVIGSSLKADLTADYRTLMPLVEKPAALVAEINQVLAGGALSASTQAQIAEAVDSVALKSTSAKENRIFIALTLVMASPEFIVQK